MLADTEFIILPYASQRGRSILQLLVEELSSEAWSAFYGAVAFAKQSGNDGRLLDALAEFAKRGGTISLTLGADVFGPTSRGSEYDAVETLLETLDPYPQAKLYLYHESRRTFHPKLYLFAHENAGRAMAVVGSSNWTEGGLAENVEANVLVRFDLAQKEHKSAFDEVKGTLERYWTESA
jgi:HKD family nuclease